MWLTKCDSLAFYDGKLNDNRSWSGAIDQAYLLVPLDVRKGLGIFIMLKMMDRDLARACLRTLRKVDLHLGMIMKTRS